MPAVRQRVDSPSPPTPARRPFQLPSSIRKLARSRGATIWLKRAPAAKADTPNDSNIYVVPGAVAINAVSASPPRPAATPPPPPPAVPATPAAPPLTPSTGSPTGSPRQPVVSKTTLQCFRTLATITPRWSPTQICFGLSLEHGPSLIGPGAYAPPDLQSHRGPHQLDFQRPPLLGASQPTSHHAA